MSRNGNIQEGSTFVVEQEDFEQIKKEDLRIAVKIKSKLDEVQELFESMTDRTQVELNIAGRKSMCHESFANGIDAASLALDLFIKAHTRETEHFMEKFNSSKVCISEKDLEKAQTIEKRLEGVCREFCSMSEEAEEAANDAGTRTGFGNSVQSGLESAIAGLNLFIGEQIGGNKRNDEKKERVSKELVERGIESGIVTFCYKDGLLSVKLGETLAYLTTEEDLPKSYFTDEELTDMAYNAINDENENFDVSCLYEKDAEEHER